MWGTRGHILLAPKHLGRRARHERHSWTCWTEPLDTGVTPKCLLTPESKKIAESLDERMKDIERDTETQREIMRDYSPMAGPSCPRTRVDSPSGLTCDPQTAWRTHKRGSPQPRENTQRPSWPSVLRCLRREDRKWTSGVLCVSCVLCSTGEQGVHCT